MELESIAKEEKNNRKEKKKNSDVLKILENRPKYTL